MDCGRTAQTAGPDLALIAADRPCAAPVIGDEARLRARPVREILSFSKSAVHYELVNRWFIIQFNLDRKASFTR